MSENSQNPCPDCGDQPVINRRRFVETVGGAALIAGSAPLMSSVWAGPADKRPAETAAAELYQTFSDSQKKTLCFPFDHQLRTKLSANWHVTEPEIDDDFFTKEQRELTRKVVQGATSEDGYKRFLQQMEYDSGGFGRYSIALFGQPGSGQFEFLLTGRHLTLRADGDSTPQRAFGGPVVYGHGVESPKKNLFYYQTVKANEVFQALDADQQKRALLPKAPRESAVEIQGAEGAFPGVAIGELSSDQRELVESVVKVILSPYREADVNEALQLLKAGGGFDKLHLSFYESGDLDSDKVWDIWRLEGPSFVWHFRGAPHVHTYVNIGLKQA